MKFDRRNILPLLVLAFGIAGLLLRVYIVSISQGCNDLQIWWGHTEVLKDHGFVWAYGHTGAGTPYILYNHPPLAGAYALFCRSLSNGQIYRFSVLFKLPAIAAEIIAACLVGSIWRRKSGNLAGAIAFTAYSFALSSIAVSAFHCNTDVVASAFALLACERSERGRHGMAGAALAIAVSIKLIPLLISLVLFVRARTWKEKAWLLAGSSLAILPYVPFLGDLDVVMKSTLGYVPTGDHWGPTYLFGLFDARLLREPSTALKTFFVVHGKLLVSLTAVVAGALAIRKRCSVYGAASLALLGFMSFSPGFGVQYVVAAAPLLIAFDVAIGFTHATICGIFITSVYLTFMLPGVPYQSTFMTAYPPGPSALGMLAWGYGLLVMAYIGKRELSLVR